MRKYACLLLAVLVCCMCIGCSSQQVVYSDREESILATSTTASAKTTATTTVVVKRTTQPKTRLTTTRTRRTVNKAPSASLELKVMTFNVRYKDDANGHGIAERAPRVEATINTHLPDIIGLQEVVPAWHAEITKRLEDEYGIATHYRSTKNPEGLTILYKKDMFELLEEDFFWLSETPDTESKGWGAKLPRIASWALLRHRETGREILFFCYHGEWNDAFAANSCEMITEQMEKHPDAVHLLVGDFNLSATTAGYSCFTEHFADARQTAGGTGYLDSEGSCPAGYPDPQAADGDKNNVIDYIFYKKAQGQAVSFAFDRTRYDGYYASDHYAGVSVLYIR